MTNDVSGISETYVSHGSTKKIENKRVSENRLDNLTRCCKGDRHGQLARGCWGV
jgi:hypothetical protein